MLFWLRTLLILLGLALPTFAVAHEHCAPASLAPAMAHATGKVQGIGMAKADHAVAVWTAQTGSIQEGCAPCGSSGHGVAGCECMNACCAVPSAAFCGTRTAFQTSIGNAAPDRLTARLHQPPTPPPRA